MSYHHLKHLIIMAVLPFMVSLAEAAEYSNSIGMEFMAIPAGRYIMGSHERDKVARSDEMPQHEVTISKPFYIGKYEVTQEQWTKVMGADPYSMERSRGSSWDSLLATGRFYGKTHPATVSWYDAQEFIKRLNKMEGHNRYRLPTEAEWEYVARAGAQTRFHFGDDIKELSLFGWCGEDFSSGSTHAVGLKVPNSWGLYDVHGNVWEWVQDWYDANYYSSSQSVDPKGSNQGTGRVVRGGSWHQTADGWHSAFRKYYPPDYRGISIGFRIILEQ